MPEYPVDKPDSEGELPTFFFTMSVFHHFRKISVLYFSVVYLEYFDADAFARSTLQFYVNSDLAFSARDLIKLNI
jgi:hypothetical protein